MSEDQVDVYLSPNRHDRNWFILEADQPASVPVVKDLYLRLLEDPQVGHVALVVQGVARAPFAELVAKINTGSAYARSGPRIIKISYEDLKRPYEIAIAVQTDPKTPHQLVFTAKSRFGCSKLYFVAFGSYAGVLQMQGLDAIDAIFVEDEIAAQLHEVDLLALDPKKIIPVGTAALDALKTQDAEALRKKGRAAWGIPDEAIVYLHTDFPETVRWRESDGLMIGQMICISDATEAFRYSLRGIQRAAERDSSPYVFWYRPHPRSERSQTSLHLRECRTILVAKLGNVRIIEDVYNVTGDEQAQFKAKASFDEAVYAADAVGCPAGSTYTLRAPYYGRQALVYAFAGDYPNTAMILNSVFSPNKQKALRELKGVSIVCDTHEVAQAIEKAKPFEPLKLPQDNATENILKYVLE